MTYLTSEQYAQLLAPVNPKRVHRKDGLSHMEAYDVRAHLNRIFGFGRWSADVIEMTLVNERFGPNSKGKDACYVVYRAGLRLTIRSIDGTELATYTEYAAGDALGFPVIKLGDAHDFAMKTAESQALKRAATNLGDQFGLSLYNNGSMNRIVGGTLNAIDGKPKGQPVDKDVEEVAPEPEPVIEGEEPYDWDAAIVNSRNNRDLMLSLLRKAEGMKAPQEIINRIIEEGKKLSERQPA